MAKVGTSFIDITDLTETLPLTLMLETNRDQNVQIKNGDLYTPNFKEGEGLIITPSLFIGHTEIIPFPYENIRYQVGEKDSENNTELDFSYANKHGYSDISVDKEGRLIYKKNLEKDLTVEARIEGYKHKDKDDIVASSVIASNPKTILFLEQGSNLYNLIITSKNGREHFEESNREPIPLKAILYKGAQEVTNVTYEWDIVTDTDTDSDEDNNYPNGPDFKVVGQNLEVQRSWVSTLEVFQCTATLNDGSNLKFEAQKIIRDFVDNFSATIISDKARILNPENSEITLTNNIYHLGNLVTDTSRITSYSWFLFYKNQEEKLIQEGISNTLAINLNTEGNIFPKEDFSILCVALIDGKERVVAYTDIIYRETFYRPVVSPKTIFVPVNKDGIPTLKTFSHEIKFQLVDDGNNILDYIGQTSFAPSLKSNDNSSFGNISQTVGKWEFKIPFSLDLSNNNNFWTSNLNSKIYEFTYTYLNTEFTEEFEVVKNYAGQDGKDGSPGFSGYTIDLSNEFHAFSGGEMKADSNQSTSCLVSAYFGDARKTIKKIEIGNINDKKEIYPTSNEVEYIVPNNKGYLYFSSQKKQDNEININIKTATSGDKFLTGIEPIPIYITIEGQDGKDLIFSKIFTYTINYNGKSYFLNLSDNNIKYSEPTNTYSPNQITISALCRETSGAARAYSEGKIIYSIDEGESWKYYENSPIITNNGTKFESIMIRLYSALAKEITSSATLNDSLLNNNSKYLLDMETIQVLTSMDGYQFGGDNLIKWSKNIASSDWTSTTKWRKSTSTTGITLSRGIDGDFSTMDFDITNTGSTIWKAFTSPKFSYTKDMLNKKFCLSFLFYCDDYSVFASGDNYPLFIIAATDTLEYDGRDAYNSIGSIRDTEEKSSMIFMDPLVPGNWCRVYQTFTLSSDFLNRSDRFVDKNNDKIHNTPDEDTPSLPETWKYLEVRFYLKNNGKFRIKQPKLEIGNIPTSWSASPYDVTSYDIFGDNLLNENTLNYTILQENSPQTILDDLEPNSYYTISWEEINAIKNSTQISFEFKGTESIYHFDIPNPNFSYTFKTPDQNCSLIAYAGKKGNIYTGEEIQIKKIKLEKGTEATSFSFTQDQIQELLKKVEDNLNDSIDNISKVTYAEENKIPTLTLANGQKITFENYQDFAGKIKELSDNVTKIKTGDQGLSVIWETIGNYNEIENSINLYEDYIKLNVGKEYQSNPHIEIRASADGQYECMRLYKDKLGFYTSSQAEPIAYLSNSKLFITKAEFTESFRIGKSIKKSGLGFLSFNVADNGVIVVWENE